MIKNLRILLGIFILLVVMGMVSAENESEAGSEVQSSGGILSKIVQFFKNLFGSFDPEAVIESFEDCVAAGNPVLESNPEQCRTPGGKVFTKEVSVQRRAVAVVEEVPETVPEEAEQPAVDDSTHIVPLIDGGFGVPSIEIKVGDKVIWENQREGRYNKALIIGTRTCSKLKSGFLNPGESYEWTFTQAGTCFIADGIYTTQSMNVIVS